MMEDTIKWKVKLQLAKNDKGFYLIAKLCELIGNDFVEIVGNERILKLSDKNDTETQERLRRIANEHHDEIADMYFNGRLYKAKKFF